MFLGDGDEAMERQPCSGFPALSVSLHGPGGLPWGVPAAHDADGPGVNGRGHTGALADPVF